MPSITVWGPTQASPNKYHKTSTLHMSWRAYPAYVATIKILAWGSKACVCVWCVCVCVCGVCVCGYVGGYVYEYVWVHVWVCVCGYGCICVMLLKSGLNMYEHKDAMLLTKGCSPMPSSVLNVESVKVILFSISIVFTFSIVYVCVWGGGGGGGVREIKWHKK